MDGRWVPMKRTGTGVAHADLEPFPRRCPPAGRLRQACRGHGHRAAAGLDAMYAKGTNLHHGLLLADRHFRKRPNAQPVLLIVTDGEPTARLESSGDVFFGYPPHPVTVARSVQELDNAKRLGGAHDILPTGSRSWPGAVHRLDGPTCRRLGRGASARRSRCGGRRLLSRVT
ncbi:hypothetical protein [Aeromicrobium sp. UC242_57]|uniref:hypothetical protein n=1 Tax=Aeromicrobium sp. UC242_57 TaxID=3374624 RepID=UPI0037C0A3BC